MGRIKILLRFIGQDRSSTAQMSENGGRDRITHETIEQTIEDTGRSAKRSAR